MSYSPGVKRGMSKSMEQKRLDASTEVARLNAKARVIRFKSQVVDITLALQENPELAPNVFDHMTALGVRWASGNENMRHTLNPKFEIPVEKAQASDTSTYEAASDVGSAVVNAAFMEDDDDDMNSSLSPLPSCYVNYNILSVRLMLMALREVEPSIFNEFSIVALKPNRRKKIPRECVVRLMEYSFGVCDGECIAAHLHVGDAFKNHLISLYHSRGKIVASMCLPPNWPELGIYSVERHADHFVLRSKLIPHASLKLRGQRLENVDFATVHIQMNWSERSALLTDSSGRLREQCSSLMASVESFEQVTGGQEVNSAIEKEENQVVAGGLLQLPSSGSKMEVKVQQTPAKRQKNT
jgi:hypothetical protein